MSTALKPLHDELLQTAVRLGRDGETGADFRRSVSTSYYSLFHWLAGFCADTLAGKSPARRSQRAWRHVYRRLAHRHARERCNDLKRDSRDFPEPILKFAEEFVTLQEKRELADYDPEYQALRTDARACAWSAVLAIQAVESARVKDQRAFAIWVLLQPPRRT